MNMNLFASLRSFTTAFFLLIVLAPVTASAYTSTGADGLFQPTTSVVLNNSTQSIFNFTDIYIPSGVTLSFSDLASTQPIELLATGNIDIAGSLNFGTSNFWIETPGSISISGSINSTGGNLSLVANTVNLSGVLNLPNSVLNIGTNGGNSSLTNSGASGAICLSSGTSNNCSSSNGSITLGNGSITLGNGSLVSGGGSSVTYITGGGSILTSGGNISLVGNNLVSLVPEPGEWAMLLLGLFALFAVSQLRKQNIFPA
jgi:hypothetical protein